MGNIHTGFDNPLEHRAARFWMDDFTATKGNDEPNLISFFKKSANVPDLEVVVVIIRLGTELDLFDLDDGRALLRVIRLFRLLILKLAVVHNTTDRGHGLRRDLDEIESLFFRQTQRFVGRHDAELAAIVADHAHFRYADTTVDAIRILRGRSLRWSRNGSSSGVVPLTHSLLIQARTHPLGNRPFFHNPKHRFKLRALF